MIVPLALMGLLALPVIVAFYMLRLRRRDYPVGSTFLWQQLIRDVEANAPWQRLRFSWLLLVQLLIAAIVVLAAARPFTAATSDLAANVVLIVDTSASMASSTDGEDRMLDRAKLGVLAEPIEITVAIIIDEPPLLNRGIHVKPGKRRLHPRLEGPAFANTARQGCPLPACRAGRIG